MSIALEAKVEALEARVADLERELQKQKLLEKGAPFLPLDFLQLMRRVEELERTAQRKPGPKPKDAANG